MKVLPALLRFTIARFRRVSPEKAERLGARLGGIAYHLSKKHRERALTNLALAFPDMPTEERQRIAKEVLRHFGRVTTDLLRAPFRSKEELLASVVEFEGKEHLEQALASGKGALILSGHHGSFERAPAWVAAMGYPIGVVVRDPNDPEINEIVREARAVNGVQLFSRGSAIRDVLRALKHNQAVALLVDQNSSEIFVPFFGHPCGCTLSGGVVAQRTNSPILPMFFYRVGPCQYKAVVGAPLQPEAGYDYPEGIVRAFNSVLEAAIRDYPEQYLWIHNRWKSARERGLVP